jgi:hypothetical protein
MKPEEKARRSIDEQVDKRDRMTRQMRWERLDEDLVHDARQLDRDVVAPDQIRTVIRAFRDRLRTEIFPGRTEVPKTLIFAKDDSHAEDIVRIVREEFGKGNEFCQKVTYKSEGKPEEIIAAFRNSYNPRVAATVDMIATGTDVKPIEILLFMRRVQSANYFEQMIGRGTRVISETDLQAATPNAVRKTHFAIVDAVGAVEHPSKKYKEPAPPDTEGLLELPEGWTVASMDQLTTLMTSGPRHWSKYYGKGDGVFLMAQNVRPGKLDLSYRKLIDPPEGDSSRERSQVSKGDLLVTIVGANTGDVCQVSRELPNHYICQSVALMRPVDPIFSDFLTLYLTSPENGQRQYHRYIYAGRPHLKFDELSDELRMTAVMLPPLAEQRHIVAEVERRLSVVAALEREVEAALARAGRLRQSVLKRAFEGRLVAQDPSDGPASVLLGRIREKRERTGKDRQARQMRLPGT